MVSYEISRLRLRDLLRGGILLRGIDVKSDRERLRDFRGPNCQPMNPEHAQQSHDDAQDALSLLSAMLVGLGGLFYVLFA